MTILDAIAKAGVAVGASEGEPSASKGKRDSQTKVMTTLFARLFAEVERDLISERTREGLRPGYAGAREGSACQNNPET